MKALLFERNGIQNLKVVDLPDAEPKPDEVVVEVKLGGVNPIDLAVVERIPVKLPHIPGAEVAGVIKSVGSLVTDLKPGDRVTVYNRVFDGTCDMCVSGRENMCRNGGIMSVITDGGYRQLYPVPARNAIKVGDMPWELAASLPTAAISAYHALRESELRAGEYLVVLGATGNTGRFAVQLGKMLGAETIAVSRAKVEVDGADHVLGYDNLKEEVRKVTNGKMADVVVNSVGKAVWDQGLSVLAPFGRLVTFGVLTGGDVTLNLSWLYGNHVKLIGVTGGTRREMFDLIRFAPNLRVRTWKKFPLESGRDALASLSTSERSYNGRAFIEFSS
ncbi:MAG: alcohol dehydrogenase catalytic domain-containing protein [Thermoprotei archaeon]|nr:alcohol dehydrogenase catalytic domain-containing protein [TACK group archaeon]